MKRPPILLRKGQKGAILVVALFVMLLLSIQGLIFLSTAMTEDNIATNATNHTRAFYAAEAGLESAVVDLRTLLATNATPTDAQLSAIAIPMLSNANYSFDTFEVTRTTATPYQTPIPSGPYQGLNALTTDYQITSEASGPKGSRARLGQIVQYQEIPLFQFGVFYGRGVDLEIAPGPPMTFNGRVHANSDIYIVHDTTKFNSFLTTTGDIYRYLKRDPSTRGSDPQIKDSTGTYQSLNFDHEYDQNFANPWAPEEWKEAALSTFNGLVQDSAMDV
ncbi:MAG: PilX N-terminal domain-containing pilus assembly protein, partial [Candidatus Methylomirabilales bacterium]